ncbi:MAG: hypothetical protein HXY34_09870 [Candidatus Thorarchaeota archaeon]|nr:hypothetical protein [Candidatus Thorarchaeota archaeon]
MDHAYTQQQGDSAIQSTDTHPLIVGLFPLLVLIPAALTFVILLVLRHRRMKPNPIPLPITRKQVVRCIQLAVVVPYLCMFGSVLLVFLANEVVAGYWFFFFKYVLHGVMCLLVGIVAGVLLAVAYGYYNVSTLMVLASLMCIPSLLTLQFGVSASALGTMLDSSDGFILFPVLFWSGCQGQFMQRVFRVEEPSDQTKSEFLWQVASIYVIEVIHTLRSRSTSGSDALAEKTLEGFLGASGPIGEFIRATEARSRTGLSSDSRRLRASPSEMRQLLPDGDWRMKEGQFRRRVLVNRVLFLISGLLLAVSCLLISSAPLSYASQWSLTLLSGLLLVAVLLAPFDPLFSGQRMDATTATLLLLAPLEGFETDVSVLTEREPVSPVSPADATEGVLEDSWAPTLLSPDSIERQPHSLRFFLTRVAKGEDEVYEESVRPERFLYAALVVILGLSFPAMVLSALHHQNVLDVFLLLSVLGVVSFVIAGAWWSYSLVRRAMFRGVWRSRLSLALSYLDAVESGHSNLGPFVPVPRPPGQFALLSWGGISASRALLRKLQRATTLRPSPSIERQYLELENSMVRAFFPFLLLVIGFMGASSSLVSGLFPFGVLFLLLFALMLPPILYQYARNRKRLLKTVTLPPSEVEEESTEVVAEVLHMLRSEYSCPLRIMVVREHPELVFTGRSFLTTSGVRMREALFIPSAGTTSNHPFKG